MGPDKSLRSGAAVVGHSECVQGWRSGLGRSARMNRHCQSASRRRRAEADLRCADSTVGRSGRLWAMASVTVAAGATRLNVSWRGCRDVGSLGGAAAGSVIFVVRHPNDDVEHPQVAYRGWDIRLLAQVGQPSLDRCRVLEQEAVQRLPEGRRRP